MNCVTSESHFKSLTEKIYYDFSSCILFKMNDPDNNLYAITNESFYMVSFNNINISSLLMFSSYYILELILIIFCTGILISILLYFFSRVYKTNGEIKNDRKIQFYKKYNLDPKEDPPTEFTFREILQINSALYSRSDHEIIPLFVSYIFNIMIIWGAIIWYYQCFDNWEILNQSNGYKSLAINSINDKIVTKSDYLEFNNNEFIFNKIKLKDEIDNLYGGYITEIKQDNPLFALIDNLYPQIYSDYNNYQKLSIILETISGQSINLNWSYYIVYLFISIVFVISISKIILIFSENKFQFDYEKERHYIFDFNKSITAERKLNTLLHQNKPKRGCSNNIGFSNRETPRDTIIKSVNNQDPQKRSDLISYNQINNNSELQLPQCNTNSNRYNNENVGSNPKQFENLKLDLKTNKLTNENRRSLISEEDLSDVNSQVHEDPEVLEKEYEHKYKPSIQLNEFADKGNQNKNPLNYKYDSNIYRNSNNTKNHSQKAISGIAHPQTYKESVEKNVEQNPSLNYRNYEIYRNPILDSSKNISSTSHYHSNEFLTSSVSKKQRTNEENDANMNFSHASFTEEVKFKLQKYRDILINSEKYAQVKD